MTARWLDPILTVRKVYRPCVWRKDGTPMPSTARTVVIDGVEYESIIDAQRKLRCSASKVYRLIGEQWRYSKVGEERRGTA